MKRAITLLMAALNAACATRASTIHESLEVVEIQPQSLPERSADAPPADDVWLFTNDGERVRLDPGRIRLEGRAVVLDSFGTLPESRLALEDVHAIWFEARTRRVIAPPESESARKGNGATWVLVGLGVLVLGGAFVAVLSGGLVPTR